MKFTNFQRKSVSLIVLATFIALLNFWATPAPAATTAGNSETAIAQGGSGGPSFIEEEGTPEAFVKKEKKFPWLIVGLGLVAVGIVVYFLVIKKPKYTLNVTLGTGCTGTPAATTKYKKDTTATYNYSASAGFGAQVQLDGVEVPASGTIKMDKDHTLTVNAVLDIRGTWFLSATNLSTPTFNIEFTGMTTSGTLRLIDFTNTGTYTVNGENVNFDIGEGITFTGRFENSNKMSGTHSGTNYGDWSATRGAAATGIPAVPQTVVRQKTK